MEVLTFIILSGVGFYGGLRLIDWISGFFEKE